MKEQHPSWIGIVPCFESGQEYLNWIKSFIEIWETFDPLYQNYFLSLRAAVDKYSYDAPIDEEVMCKALERSQATGEMIYVEADAEYLPGGSREGQCDGWQYHLVFLTQEDYFIKQKEVYELQDSLLFVERQKQDRQNANEGHSLIKPYTDSDGNVYESYEAYCNSPDLDDYTVMLKLHNGIRKPQNDWERSLLKEMREIEASGGQIDFSESIP